MSRSLIKRTDGTTVDNEVQDANQADIANLAKRTILVDDSRLS